MTQFKPGLPLHYYKLNKLESEELLAKPRKNKYRSGNGKVMKAHKVIPFYKHTSLL